MSSFSTLQTTGSASGALGGTSVATAISYTMASTDTYIGVTSTAAPRTITLLAAGTFLDGRIVDIKDESGGAAANNITITPNGADTIDGVNAPVPITQNYGEFSLVKRGTGWWIV